MVRKGSRVQISIAAPFLFLDSTHYMKKTFYEKHVASYQKVTDLWFPGRHKKLIRLINNRLQPKKVLDVACGTGSMINRMKKHFPDSHFYGIDASKPMIEFAANNCSDCIFKQASADDLPFKSGSFDVVTNSISFHHYLKPAEAILESYRVLKPGGQFILMDITPKYNLSRVINDFAAKYIIRDGHVGFHKLSSVKNMLESSGFNEVKQHFVGIPGVYITSGIKP
jgi:ubiquinone/menaquinone biosynthesis C-methylase UbiE